MPFLETQVELLNRHLVGTLFSHKRFANGVVWGLAEMITENREQNADVRYPAIYDEQDEPKRVVLDDTYPFQSYHRAISVTPEVPDTDFGDTNDTITTAAEMVMIVAAKRRMVKLSASKLLGLIILALPTNITDLSGSNIDNLNFEFGGGELDPLVVFGEEYTGVDFRVPPESILIKISYTMRAQYRKNCLSICDCLDGQ